MRPPPEGVMTNPASFRKQTVFEPGPWPDRAEVLLVNPKTLNPEPKALNPNAEVPAGVGVCSEASSQFWKNTSRLSPSLSREHMIFLQPVHLIPTHEKWLQRHAKSEMKSMHEHKETKSCPFLAPSQGNSCFRAMAFRRIPLSNSRAFVYL